MKQIIVKSDCIRCGLCFSENKFFKEDELGYSKVANSNLIEDKDFKEIKEIIDNCPIHAIEAIDVNDESHAIEVVRVPVEETEKNTANKTRRNKRFSLLKMFGNLDLDEIDEPDTISSQILDVIKNKESSIYRKLERKVRDTIEDALNEDDDYIEMNRKNFYIECQMNINDHRLKMDKVKLNYYFNISDDVLDICTAESKFEVSIGKPILVKVFLLTALYEKYGIGVNSLSYNDIVSCANSFIKKGFEIFNESRPTALTIVLGATLAAIASEVAIRIAVEASIEAVVNAARESWKSEKDVMEKVVQDTVVEAAFKTTIKPAIESVLTTMITRDNEPTFNAMVETTFNTAIEPASRVTMEAIRNAAVSGRTYSNLVFMDLNFHESAMEAAFSNIMISDMTIRSASEVIKKMGYDEAIESAKITTVDLSKDLAVEAARQAILSV